MPHLALEAFVHQPDQAIASSGDPHVVASEVDTDLKDLLMHAEFLEERFRSRRRTHSHSTSCTCIRPASTRSCPSCGNRAEHPNPRPCVLMRGRSAHRQGIGDSRG